MTQSPAVPFFVAGGTVPVGAASYVARDADRALLEALLAGRYAYVLTSRQMGKSSLSVRTMEALREKGVRTAFVDLTRVGGRNVTPEQWYAGLLGEVGRGLGDRAAMLAHWKAHPELGPMQRFFGALREAVLAIPEPIAVFIDEIDATRSLPFSTDEFFAGIRECFNRRVEDSAMARLAFCLIGVAIPSDLMSDAKLTPFNVGERVVLRDFSASEAAAFAAGLSGTLPLGGGQGGGKSDGKALVARVHHWTGGHPFLTQSLGRRLAEEGAQTPGDVDRLVAEEFFETRARETNVNLADVGNRVLNSYDDPEGVAKYRADVLSLYERVLKERRVPDDESNRLVAVLKLAGLVEVEDGRLRVRNRIYERTFGLDWVREHMPGQEFRRQRRAFWRGALRTALVSAAVVAVVSTLAVVAVNNARAAERNAQEANRARERADAQTRLAETAQKDALAQKATAEAARDEARDQRDVATQAQKTATRSAAELRVALGVQLSLRGRADAAAREATAQKRVAQRSATEATTQRNLVRATNRTLEGQVYESTFQSLDAAWERRDPGEIAPLVASIAGHRDKGWEWGYWHRLSKAVYTIPNDPSAGHKSIFAPAQGSVCVVYDEISAQRIDPLSGKVLRELWRLPRPARYIPIFSPNGRWVVRDDERHRRVLQDLDRGTVRPLPSAPAGTTAFEAGVSDDGLRVMTRHDAGAAPTRLTMWDALSGRALATRALTVPFTSCLGLSPDGRTALLGYEDHASGRVGVADWDVDTDRIGTVYAFPRPADSGSVRARFGPDGSRIVGSPSRVAVFDQGRPEPRLVLAVGATYPSGYVSPDGRFLVTRSGVALAFYQNELNGSQIWDFRTGAPVAEVPWNGVLVGSGRLFLGRTRGGLAGVDWRATQPYRETTIRPDRLPQATDPGSATPPEERTYLDPALDDDAVVWSAHRRFNDGLNRLALGLYDPDGRFLARYPATGEIPKGEAVTVSGPNLLVRDGERLQVRRLPDLRLARALLGVRGSMPQVGRDGRRAASIDERGLLRVWSDGPRPAASIPTGLTADGSGSPECLLSPDGTQALVYETGYDYARRFEVWDLRTLRRVAASSSDYARLAWSPTGQAVSILSDEEGLVAYDPASKMRRTVLPPDTSAASGDCFPALSPDGRLVAFSLNGVVEVRSVRTGRRLFTLDTRLPSEGQARVEIADLAFSRDGHRLSVLYNDGRLRVFRDDH